MMVFVIYYSPHRRSESEILLPQFRHASIHRGKHLHRVRLFLVRTRDRDLHEPSFLEAKLVVDREIILEKEASVTDEPALADHAEFLAYRIDRDGIIIPHRLNDRLSLVLRRKDDRRRI